MVIEYVFHVHGCGRDMQHAIAPVDDVTLGCDENVFTLGQENFFRFSGLVGKTEKLEVDRWRGWNRRRLVHAGVLNIAGAVSLKRLDLCNRSGDENVSAIARVLGLFALAEQFQV